MCIKANQNGRKATKRRQYIIIPCYYYVSLIYSLSYTTPTDAFTPGGGRESLLNKNKKCQGGTCPANNNRSTAAAAPTRNSSSTFKKMKVRRGTFCCDNDGRQYGNENFAIMMAKFKIEQLEEEKQKQKEEGGESEQNNFENREIHSESMIYERRMFVASLFASTTSASGVLDTDPANAFEKSYPVNLDFDDDDTSINLQSIRQERIAVQKSQAKQVKSDLLTQPFMFRTKQDIAASVVWGGALWLLSGSRSNPLVRPLANVLYDENTEEGSWVKDRNEGLFAPLPASFALIMGVVFLILGFVTDRGLLLVSEGNSDFVLNLAGVSLIGGASLELGRIASGEKMITREDLTRETELATEFSEFASNRLIVGEGGAVHRSEIIKAFRRYFAKYRVENDQYPLTDLEIERLLRTWNRKEGNEEGLSSAGFLKGVKINDQAIIR